METRKWNPTGSRQGDGTMRPQNSLVNSSSKRHRVLDRVRVFAGSVKWSYLELEDDLKCRFWKLFSGSRARCNSKDCPTCNPGSSDVPRMTPVRDGRFSTLLQKIRTWPRLGSRRIRDHTSQEAPQPGSGFGLSHIPDRIKAASFPAKRRDLSRARFLPRFKKFESIREENDHGASVATENDLPHGNETDFVNVVGVDIPGSDAEATPSVEDLEKYSFSFGSDRSFGIRDDSMSKDVSLPPDLRSSTLGYHVPASTGASDGSVNAVPAPQTFNRAWDVPSSPLGQGVPAPAVSSEVSESAGPGGFDNVRHFHSPQLIESPIPEACATSQVPPKSRYNGVRWKAKKWTSEIRPPNSTKTVWLGTYATEEQAASAFDAGIFYYDKAKDYNFPDSESLLPPLDRSMDERRQLHFIKTQARLIAKARAHLMTRQATVTSRDIPHVHYSPGTPDTSSSGAGPSASSMRMTEPSRSKLSFLPALKRAMSGEAELPKNSRPRNF